MPARFKLEKTADGQFHFALIAANGQIICQSEPYATKQSARIGIEALRASAPVAVLDDVTEDRAIAHRPLSTNDNVTPVRAADGDLAKRLLEIGARSALAAKGKGATSLDHDALFYDEDGLPT